MLRVLIADDHSLVREGLKLILLEAGIASVVGEARNGAEALEMALAEPWDLVVLDITMPVENGLSVLRKLARRRPELPVIMLSMHTAYAYVEVALKAGAAGYLSKEAAPHELIEAIAEVLRGRKYISQELRVEPDEDTPGSDAGPDTR